MKKGTLDLQLLEELLPAVIFGAEGDDDGSPGDGESGDDGDAGSSADDDNDDDGQNDDDDEKNKDTDGLKSALRKERARANAAEKALKAKTKAEEEAKLAEKTEIEQAQTREQQAKDRAEKLATGLLQRDLNDAIRQAARDLNFIDVDDAVQGVDRSSLVWTQDDDDPTDIVIDTKSVEREVKKLATKKSHFIRSGTDDGEPTGSQFGGSKKKKTTQDDELKKKYPALRGTA